MLSGEGKENEDKTAHFFVHFFAVVLYDNIKLPSYAFYGGNVVRVFFCLLILLLPLIFTLVAARISHFVTAATKFSCRSFNNKWLLISRSSSMLLFFSLSFAGRSPTFSLSLSFSCPIFQICGHDNRSKLKTLDDTETETISAFRFRLYWLFSCLYFKRRVWLCDLAPK